MSEDTLVVLNIWLIIVAVTGLAAWFFKLRFRRRELQHREWMAAIEKGVPLPELSGIEMGMDGPRTYLLKGLIWLACGVTLTLFLSGLWLTTTERQSMDARVRQAEQLRQLGYSSEEVRGMVAPTQRLGRGFPLGLSFVGLIPAGIGVAYLAFYRLEMRRSK